MVNSDFEQLQENLEKNRCEKCLGTGEMNDAEPGDTSFRVFTCTECDGSGCVSPPVFLETS